MMAQVVTFSSISLCLARGCPVTLIFGLAGGARRFSDVRVCVALR